MTRITLSHPIFAAVLSVAGALLIMVGTGAIPRITNGAGDLEDKAPANAQAPAISSIQFRPPLDIPITLTGTFGELRRNHFHSGIDITTEGREGLPVKACADGWVSRIKISPWGFGKAVYISHPNGLMTVYAHLQGFEGSLADMVDSLHYSLKKNVLDEELAPGALMVSSGELIARSGNTGSSAGPHLHFEIRRGDTPLNPLNYGFEVKDGIAPDIRNLFFYPIWELHPVGDARSVSIVKSGGTWRSADSVIRVPAGRIGLAVLADDRANGRSNRNGIYQLQMNVDGTEAFDFSLDSFRFDETRYINAHIDYARAAQNRQRLHRCFKLPGDRNSLYRREDGDGTISLAKGERREVLIAIRDRAGNRSELRCVLLGVDPEPAPDLEYRQLIEWDRDNFVYADGLILGFPAGSLYEDLYLNYEVVAEPEAFSHRYDILDSTTPIHEAFEISIQPRNLPVRFRKRALIVRETGRGYRSSLGGRWERGFVRASSRELGEFYVAVDSTGPELRSLSIAGGSSIRSLSSLNFKATDDLAGLSEWSATVDGEWALIEFDPRKNLMQVQLDPGLASGSHLLVLKATDAVDNMTALEMTFNKLP